MLLTLPAIRFDPKLSKLVGGSQLKNCLCMAWGWLCPGVTLRWFFSFSILWSPNLAELSFRASTHFHAQSKAATPSPEEGTESAPVPPSSHSWHIWRKAAARRGQAEWIPPSRQCQAHRVPRVEESHKFPNPQTLLLSRIVTPKLLPRA